MIKKIGLKFVMYVAIISVLSLISYGCGKDFGEVLFYVLLG